MKPINEMTYFEPAEKIVRILMTKTQNKNPLFFRVIVAYYLGTLASQMRINIKGFSKGTIPINNYVIALSPSGSGKGLSTSLMEQEVLKGNSNTFIEHTLPLSAEQNCEQLAIKRASRNGTDSADELNKLGRDYQSLGAYLPSFDSATTPAIKQMRQKLLIANAGSCNLVIDEIGANLVGSLEPLITYLELYDKGLLKEKLTKSTTDSVRFERINGYTPANLLAFGTPSKLLDGAKTEELFHELLEMGYARRCIFGYADKTTKNTELSVDEAIKQMFNQDDNDYLEELNESLVELANPAYMNKSLSIHPDTLRLLVTYKLDCEKQSQQLSEIDVIKKSELEHRYFKTLKLAGTYAFIDGKDEINNTHVESAIKLVEDSGRAFAKLMTPQRPYTKLATYLADYKGEVTLADLDVDLPYFKGSKAQKEEMITMATAWGYKNNIVIKKTYAESIMFLHADSIDETNTDKMIISYSTDMAKDYHNEIVPFDKLPKLFQAKGYHWVNHHLQHSHRREENCINGFNMLVFDVDGTCNLSTAKLLLKDYKAIYYTTKSHTDASHRFRIVLPINYTLKLDAKEYKELYNNVMNDLPFDVDEQCNQRSRKWLTNDNTELSTTDGELFDILPYIPKTSRNEERQAKFTQQSDLDNLERWVINNTGEGNRNSMLLRFALILLDANFSFDKIKEKTINLNNKLADKLDELELSETVFHTVASRLAKQGKL